MSKPKKLFLVLAVIFVSGVLYFSYDIFSQTSFPGSKSYMKESLEKIANDPSTDSTDSKNAPDSISQARADSLVIDR